MLFLVIAIILAVFWLPTGWGIAAITLGIVVELGEIPFWIKFSRRHRAQAGTEALVGAEGVAVTDCRPQGTVRVRGELWGAVCPEGAAAGETVVVERVAGLTLEVRRK